MMINRSMFMISAVALICVICGLSFADPATDSLDGKEILKEMQVQHDAIALGQRVRRRGYVPQRAGYGANNSQLGNNATGKDEQQEEEKVVKDEQTAPAKDDAAKQDQKDVKDAVKTEQKDANDAVKTEQKDADDAVKTEQKDVNDAVKTEQKDAKDDEGKKDDNAAKDDETKKEEPASPFKDPQAALAFEEFNKFRVQHGLKPCEFNQNLQNIAQRHSNNMYNRRQMYHSGTSGVAENVFMGSSSGVYAVRTWINSPGHRANMLGPYRRVGIARAGGYFTMVLQ